MTETERVVFFKVWGWDSGLMSVAGNAVYGNAVFPRPLETHSYTESRKWILMPDCRSARRLIAAMCGFCPEHCQDSVGLAHFRRRATKPWAWGRCFGAVSRVRRRDDLRQPVVGAIPCNRLCAGGNPAKQRRQPSNPSVRPWLVGQYCFCIVKLRLKSCMPF